eukprot:gene8152-11033_t
MFESTYSILKFQRLEGAIEGVLRNEKICAVAIDTNNIVIGTESGGLFIISLSGQLIRSYRAHDKPINKISIDATNGVTVLSCSDTGSVVVITINMDDESKESTTYFNEPVRSVAIEPSNATNYNSKKERSFIVATSSGRIIHHRSAWFTQKDLVLFAGAGSSVTSLSWRNNLIAWCDDSVIRILDVNTQSAVCQIGAPIGVSPDDPFPCHLFWESDQELMVGWADHFKLIEIFPANDPILLAEGYLKIAKTKCEWQADCIICGISPFDANHIIMLGYTPPLDENEYNNAVNKSQSKDEDENENNDANLTNDTTNLPEILIINKSTGEIISSDCLPLKGALHNMHGPYGYHLLSSYSCNQNQSKDYMQWDIHTYHTMKGGDRGLSPITFIFSSTDLVVSRIRDVNDRIAYAIQNNDLKSAISIAKHDKSSLKHYNFNDLMNLYIIDLLESHEPLQAASECARLLDDTSYEGDNNMTGDIILWESWIYKFIKYKQIHFLCPFIPVEDINYRLPNFVYEEILKSLFYNDSNYDNETLYQSDNFRLSETNYDDYFVPKIFLEMIKKWSKITPHIFNHSQIIISLENQTVTYSFSNNNSNNNNNNMIFSNNNYYYNKQIHANERQMYYLEALAHLYTANFMYEKSLNTYLSIPTNIDTQLLSIIQQKSHNNNNKQEEYKHVFDLIEKQTLFSLVEHKIINLVRLSPLLSSKLLINNIDKLPVKSVVSQLSNDNKLLFWYLHLLFEEAYDIFSNKTEYSDLYAKLAELYADNASVSSTDNNNNNLISVPTATAVSLTVDTTLNNDNNVQISPTRSPNNMNSTISSNNNNNSTIFTTNSTKVSSSVTAVVTNSSPKRPGLPSPPSLLSNTAPTSSFDFNNNNNNNNLNHDNNSNSSLSEEEILIIQQKHKQKQYELIQQSFTTEFDIVFQQTKQNFSSQNNIYYNHNSDFLKFLKSGLPSLEYSLTLYYLGLSRLDPVLAIHAIPSSYSIQQLKLKLIRILKREYFHLFINEKCNIMLKDDALSLLRQQNQGQRKAMKVDYDARCSLCLRPIIMEPAKSSEENNNQYQFNNNENSLS